MEKPYTLLAILLVIVILIGNTVYSTLHITLTSRNNSGDKIGIDGITVNGADYVFSKTLIGNDSAIAGGIGSKYNPMSPVKYSFYKPGYLIGWINTEWNNSGGYGAYYEPVVPVYYIDYAADYMFKTILHPINISGQGSEYQPIPPVKELYYGADYLVQWLLPRSVRGGLLSVRLFLSVNTTSAYLVDRVRIVVTGTVEGFETPVSNRVVYVYDKLLNGSIVREIEAVLDEDGVAVIDTEFSVEGTHILYAKLPPRGPYSSATSNSVLVNVSRVPTETRLWVNTTRPYHDQGLKAVIRVLDTYRGRPVTGEKVYLYIIGNNTVYRLVGELDSSGKTVFIIRFNKTGRYQLYALFPKQSVYSSSCTRNITVNVVFNPLGGLLSAKLYYNLVVITTTAIILLPLLVRLGRRKEYG